MGNRDWVVGGGGGGSIRGGGEVDVGCLGRTAGVGKYGWGEAGVSGRAGGGGRLGVGDTCGRRWVGTVGVRRLLAGLSDVSKAQTVDTELGTKGFTVRKRNRGYSVSCFLGFSFAM